MMTGLSGIISELNSTGRSPIGRCFCRSSSSHSLAGSTNPPSAPLRTTGHFANSGSCLAHAVPSTAWDHSHAGSCCATFRTSLFSLQPPRSYAAPSNTAWERRSNKSPGARFWDYSKFPFNINGRSASMAPRSLERGRCSFAVSPNPPC